MGEEHEVLQAGIDGCFSGCVYVWAGMCQKMEKLNETTDCQ